MTTESKIDGKPKGKCKEQRAQFDRGTPRSYLGLEWTESEWFEVWLQLARESQKSNQN